MNRKSLRGSENLFKPAVHYKLSIWNSIQLSNFQLIEWRGEGWKLIDVIWWTANITPSWSCFKTLSTSRYANFLRVTMIAKSLSSYDSIKTCSLCPSRLSKFIFNACLRETSCLREAQRIALRYQTIQILSRNAKSNMTLWMILRLTLTTLCISLFSHSIHWF